MSKEAGAPKFGWGKTHAEYLCMDRMPVFVKLQTADGQQGPDRKALLGGAQPCRNGLVYAYRLPRKIMMCTVFASRAKTSRDMETLTSWPSDARTVSSPRSVRKVYADAFRNCGALNAVVMNEGLQVLGTAESSDKEK